MNQDPNPYQKPESEEPPEKSNGHIAKGFGFALLANVGLVFLSSPFESIWIVTLFAIGLVQLLVLVPLAIYFNLKKESKTVQGILILAGITFLLNAGCYGLVFASLGNLH